jgi:hypothetical protein
VGQEGVCTEVSQRAVPTTWGTASGAFVVFALF